MTIPPIARPRWAVFSEPNAILTIVSAAHAVNHAYSSLMPLIYPLVLNEFHLLRTQIGLTLGVASASGGLLRMSFICLSRLNPGRVLLGAGQIVMAASYAAAGLLLVPTRDVTQS